MVNLYEQNKNYYERNANNYENSSWYFSNRYKDNTLTKELEKCLKVISKKNVSVLEIGPGTGYLLSKLVVTKDIKFNYTGIEHSIEMKKIILERYQNKIEELKIINDSVTADLLTKGIGEQTYDLIIGSSILHHLPDYSEIIKLLSSLLNNKGVIYFVREPIFRNECLKANKKQDFSNNIYTRINDLLLKPGLKKFLWPRKIKQENPKDIALHMFKDGVSVQPFKDLCATDFKLIMFRKYNRRASSFFSFLENKWLKGTRMDIFGNTLFAIGLQKVK